MSFSDVGLIRYVEAVNSLNKDQVIDLCGLVLSFLLSPSTTNFQTGIAEFASSHKIGSNALKVITQGVIHQFQDAISEGYNAHKFNEKCKELGFSEEAVNGMTSVWIQQASNVATSLLSRALTNNELKDMDWIFGVTASSDDCNHVGKTFLQLKLTLSGKHGAKIINIELSLEQFYQFLASMQKCKSYLDYVLPTST